jgi:hypothetical protein
MKNKEKQHKFEIKQISNEKITSKIEKSDTIAVSTPPFRCIEMQNRAPEGSLRTKDQIVNFLYFSSRLAIFGIFSAFSCKRSPELEGELSWALLDSFRERNFRFSLREREIRQSEEIKNWT